MKTVNSKQFGSLESESLKVRREFPTSAAERYDRSLRRSLSRNQLPKGAQVPQLTSEWPVENIVLLERYRAWLVAGGASTEVIERHRIPLAGTMLGLALKPHPEICLDTDREKTLMYVRAKGMSAAWIRNCTHSLTWFCRFLEEMRGQHPAKPLHYGDVEQYKRDLPPWLLDAFIKLQHIRQANWRPSRIGQSTYRFWFGMTYVWRWLLENGLWSGDEIESIQRIHLDQFVDDMLVAGLSVKTINVALQHFQSMLRFLEQHGMRTPHHLLVMPLLKAPDPVPRFLSDGQVSKVKAGLKEQITTSKTPLQHQNGLLDRALFYMLLQTGMRVSELEDLMLEDIFLEEKRVVIREAKGIKDRSVYLTETTVEAVADYLEVRGSALTEHLFIYRYKPLSKDIVRSRIKRAGRRVGVKVTPHMLRHTFATQLLNAGCRVTSIQALLGHKRLGTTMIYARVHNETVAHDYVKAMADIEAKSKILVTKTPRPEDKEKTAPDRSALLGLLETISGENLTAEQLNALRQLRQGLVEPQPD